jgi:hypothetical protein
MGLAESLSDLTIIDACTILNLYSTGRIDDILRSLPSRFGVVDYVARKEALYVYSGVTEDGEVVRDQIDWDPLFSSGLIKELYLNDDEAETFVSLAAELDDGEAMTCAVAICRDYAVATDDLKTRRFMATFASDVRVYTTSELIKGWADGMDISQTVLHRALVDVRDRGGFVPGKRDPLRNWWDQSLKG